MQSEYQPLGGLETHNKNVVGAFVGGGGNMLWQGKLFQPSGAALKIFLFRLEKTILGICRGRAFAVAGRLLQPSGVGNLQNNFIEAQ